VKTAFCPEQAAVFCCWVTAHLCKVVIFIGVLALTQACCQPVLLSNTDQWKMYLTQSSAAVPCCWVIAYLCEEVIFIGVFAVTQGCCQPVLKSSISWQQQSKSNANLLPLLQPDFSRKSV